MIEFKKVFSIFILLVTLKKTWAVFTELQETVSSNFAVEVEKCMIVLFNFILLVSKAVTLFGIIFLKNQVKPVKPFFRESTPQILLIQSLLGQQIQYLTTSESPGGDFLKYRFLGLSALEVDSVDLEQNMGIYVFKSFPSKI